MSASDDLSAYSSTPLTPSATNSDASERSKRRPRFVFTEDERQIFRNIITNYRDVIENKKTDNVSKKAKDEAWAQLCDEYNSIVGTRTVCVAQLRKLWDNMESRWKKKKSEETREIFRTGGGTRECRPMSPATAQVGAIAEHMATRLPNPYDSDGAYLGEAVLSLPPAALLETMVSGIEQNQDDISGEVFTPVPRQATPPPWLNNQSAGAPALPVQERAAVAALPEAGPTVATSTSQRLPEAPTQPPATGSRAGGPRVAAIERTLAPEVDARIKAVEAEDLRKQQLHELDIKIRKSQLAGQRRKNKMQQKLLALEIEMKQLQLQALRSQMDH